MISSFFDRITRLAIRLRWVTIVVTVAVLVAGVFAMLDLNLELLPKIEFPQTVVVAQWSEAESAQDFLERVTIPLEDVLDEVDGVVNVESTTGGSFAFVIVRNDFGLNQDAIVEDIKAAVEGVSLPEGMEPVQVLNFSLSDLPVVTASVSSGELTLAELKDLVENDLLPKLEGIEEVSRVSLSGGQELPAETVVQASEEGTTPAEDPGRLPLVLIEGAKALGIEVEYAQDVTPEVLAGITGTADQIMAVLALIPPDTLRYAPAETLALLPIEYMDTLDPALLEELDALAQEFGGIRQYTLADAVVMLAGGTPGDEVASAEEEPEPEATIPATAAAETAAEEPEVPEVEAVDLPESWVAAGSAAGMTLATTADVTEEVMQGVLSLAPQLLDELEPAMWRAIMPEAVALALPEVAESLDPLLLAQLEAIGRAAQGIAPEPVPLPEAWTTAAAGFGMTLETTADIPAEAMSQIATLAPAMLAELTDEILLGLPAEVVAAIPDGVLADLDEGMQQTLANVAIYHMRVQMAAEEGTVGSEFGGLVLPPVALPESWIAGAAALGQTIADTRDVTPEFMEGVLNFAPDQLSELTPEMWRAIHPRATEMALESVADSLDPSLVAQLRAIQVAGKGLNPEPLPLPESWTTAAAGAGFALETTADIPLGAIRQLATVAPQLLEDLDEEILLAFTPDMLAELPESYVETLDEGLQQTIQNIFIAFEYALEVYTVEDYVEPEVEEPPVDPARLPDLLIQGARAAGQEIEFAQDVAPEFVRAMASFGPQGIQFLSMLTEDNLRLLPAESIALLPIEFLDTLDDELVAELDELAAEYGGAGQLAIAEAEAAAAASAESPPLSGIWLEPGLDGSESLFKTAGDLLNNPFVDGAAALLNFFPNSPNVQDPAEWMLALSPEVMAYLAGNEDGFVANLSPVILEMMSPETLTFLLDTYPDAFDADLTERLRGIAAGSITAFIPEATITRTDRNPSLSVALFKAGDANTVEVAHRVFDTLDAYTEENPDITTNLVFEQATFIEDAIEGVAREGALGAAFAVVVILIFLSGHVGGRYKLSWRATLVTGTSIPLSVFTAFLLMRGVPFVGEWIQGIVESSGNGGLTFLSRLFPTSVTLNIMTLSGMTVAIGRVVDDSIVVLENSYRYIQRGQDPKQAVIDGTREVAIAIFSATATTVAVFLPLGLIGGIIGSFFLPFGLTVTYALAASFVVSITVVPVLAYLLIRRQHIPEERETTMQRWYTPILKWALGHRFYTMVIATIIFFSSLFLLRQLPQSFIPELGDPTINISISLPSGTAMADTNDLVEELEAAIADLHGVETVQTEIGSSGGFESFFAGGGVSQNLAGVTVSVHEQEDLIPLTNEIRENAEEIFGEDIVRVSAASQASFGGFSMILTGDSADQLRLLVDDVKGAIASVDMDADGVPDIANVSSNVDNGDSSGNGDSSIIRIDGRPAISFSGELETENTLGVTNVAKQAINDMGLPAGVEVTEGFESEQQVQGFRSMVTAIGYSIVIVYAIMALTFRSLIHPFTILFSLPFALVGAALALFISGSVLGISAMIGLMMLVGIVVTNGIVLMELVQQLRRRGRSAYDALVHGGRTRLRPIWMTALAAILALIPLGLSKEAGAIIASELALVVMGGLLVSTALTLVVIPVIYSLFDQLGGRLRRRDSA